MKRVHKISLAVVTAGLLFFVMFCWMPSGVPVLAYHMVGAEEEELYSVSPAEFDRQLAYLKENGYTAVSLQEMFSGFAGTTVLPTKPVIITFDDGYRDNYLTALPILEKHGMKATVFVVAGQAGQGEYLSWDQVRALHKRGTEIGSHTMNHVALSEISPAEQLREAVESKEILERELGAPVVFLAYPYGKFTTETVAVLQAAGYHGACSGIPGLNAPDTSRYSLKRVNVPKPRLGLWEFKIRLLRAKIVFGFELLENRLR
ncbi:MAG: polysaccharide deacetylase [Firmicutes bacterium]|nr:polysaccharide deacetylase [Bacillota bacterium]